MFLSRILSIFIGVFLLSACSDQELSVDKVNENITSSLAYLQKNPSEGVVIGTATIIKENILGETRTAPGVLVFTTGKLEPGTVGHTTMLNSPLGKYLSANSTQVSMKFGLSSVTSTLPVTYALLRIGQNGTAEFDYGGWAIKTPVTININSGEIVYIGHTTMNKDNSFAVEDRFDEFLATYPALDSKRNKIVKRLLKFPPL